MSLEQYLLLKAAYLKTQIDECPQPEQKRIQIEEFICEFISFSKHLMGRTSKTALLIIAELIEKAFVMDFTQLRRKPEQEMPRSILNRALKLTILDFPRMELHLVQLFARLECMKLMYEFLMIAEKIPKGFNYREKFESDFARHLDQIKVISNMSSTSSDERRNTDDTTQQAVSPVKPATATSLLETVLLTLFNRLLSNCACIEFFTFLNNFAIRNELPRTIQKHLRGEYETLAAKFSKHQPSSHGPLPYSQNNQNTPLQHANSNPMPLALDTSRRSGNTMNNNPHLTPKRGSTLINHNNNNSIMMMEVEDNNSKRFPISQSSSSLLQPNPENTQFNLINFKQSGGSTTPVNNASQQQQQRQSASASATAFNELLIKSSQQLSRKIESNNNFALKQSGESHFFAGDEDFSLRRSNSTSNTFNSLLQSKATVPAGNASSLTGTTLNTSISSILNNNPSLQLLKSNSSNINNSNNNNNNIIAANAARSLTKPIQSGRTMYSLLNKKVVRNSSTSSSSSKNISSQSSSSKSGSKQQHHHQSQLKLQSTSLSSFSSQTTTTTTTTTGSGSGHSSAATSKSGGGGVLTNILFEAASRILQEQDAKRQSQLKLMSRESSKQPLSEINSQNKNHKSSPNNGDNYYEGRTTYSTGSNQNSNSSHNAEMSKNQTVNSGAEDENSLPLMFNWGHN